MDGNFISTDIRYRDVLKSRRRSTSYGRKSPGDCSVGRQSVGVVTGGGAISPIHEEVSGGANTLVDDVFEEPKPQIDSVGVGCEVVGLINEVKDAEVPGDSVGNLDKLDGGAVGGEEVPVIGGNKRGVEQSSRQVQTEGEIVGNTIHGAENIYGMGDAEGHGSGGAEGGDSGVAGGSIIEPVHHMPRLKLREILAHAEGECILSVMLLCAYR